MKHTSRLFSLSAVAVGYLLISDLNSTEQNTLGNWLMLVGQFVSTSAYYSALEEEKNDEDTSKNLYDDSSTIEMLEKMIKVLEKEVNNIQEELKKSR